MKSFKANLIVLIIVIAVAVAAGIFIFPKGLGNKYSPWSFGLDLVGGSSLTYEIDLSEIDSSEYDAVAAGLREVIEKRVNLYGVSEPKITTAQKGDSYRLIVDLAGVKDLKDAVRQIGETPNLDFRELQGEGEEASFVRTNLTGRYITGATLSFDELNKPVVSLNFNEEGGKLFEEITGRNVGKPLAIFIDNMLTDAPRVNEKITGGKAVISGGGEGFTIEESKELVQRLNAGALSAPINLINQRTVSASAASDALVAMTVAGLIGILLVLIFMIMYYKSLGIFSCASLIIYITFTLAIFKSGIFGLIPSFTMTLAGIAGFVLTIGMAVDASILIFERTKEELKNGIARMSAIEEGFRRAWPSIRDANITTVISAIILYFFTSSFVQGFALALGIGVLINMFVAIFVMRTMLKVFIKN